MSKVCNFCINKEECGSCDKKWKDKFVPNENVRSYFNRGYVGTMGINGRVWSFDSTNENLQITKSVKIGGDYICPYCCEQMYSIQDNQTLNVIGHCCLCDGALTEIEHKKELELLNNKHSVEIEELNNKYMNRLLIDTNRLFEIKQSVEKERFEFFRDNKKSSIRIKGNVIDVKDIIR